MHSKIIIGACVALSLAGCFSLEDRGTKPRRFRPIGEGVRVLENPRVGDGNRRPASRPLPSVAVSPQPQPPSPTTVAPVQQAPTPPPKDEKAKDPDLLLLKNGFITREEYENRKRNQKKSR